MSGNSCIQLVAILVILCSAFEGTFAQDDSLAGSFLSGKHHNTVHVIQLSDNSNGTSYISDLLLLYRVFRIHMFSGVSQSL